MISTISAAQTTLFYQFDLENSQARQLLLLPTITFGCYLFKSWIFVTSSAETNQTHSKQHREDIHTNWLFFKTQLDRTKEEKKKESLHCRQAHSH